MNEEVFKDVILITGGSVGTTLKKVAEQNENKLIVIQKEQELQYSEIEQLAYKILHNSIPQEFDLEPFKKHPPEPYYKQFVKRNAKQHLKKR